MPELKRKYGRPREHVGQNILEMIRRWGNQIGPGSTGRLISTIEGFDQQANKDISSVPVKDPLNIPPSAHEDLSSDTPQPVGAAGNSGSEQSFSRSDHVHEGVHSVSKLGDPLLTGDVTLSGAGGVVLNQTNNNIEFDGSNVAGNRIVEYFQVLQLTPVAMQLLYTPVGDVAVYLNGLRKMKTLHYTQAGKVITFLFANFIDGELVIFDYWYQTDGS